MGSARRCRSTLSGRCRAGSRRSTKEDGWCTIPSRAAGDGSGSPLRRALSKKSSAVPCGKDCSSVSAHNRIRLVKTARNDPFHVDCAHTHKPYPMPFFAQSHSFGLLPPQSTTFDVVWYGAFAAPATFDSVWYRAGLASPRVSSHLATFVLTWNRVLTSKQTSLPQLKRYDIPRKSKTRQSRLCAHAPTSLRNASRIYIFPRHICSTIQ